MLAAAAIAAAVVLGARGSGHWEVLSFVVLIMAAYCLILKNMSSFHLTEIICLKGFFFIEVEQKNMFSLDGLAAAYCHKWLNTRTDWCIILVLAKLTGINHIP